MAKTSAQQALQLAQEKAPECPYWLDLHNALYGVGAPFGQLFPTPAERVAFSQTEESKQIQALISELRQKNGDPPPIAGRVGTANGTMTIRVPKSLHAALILEAEREGVSLNQLATVKLSVDLAGTLA